MSVLLAKFWPLGVIAALAVQTVRVERLKDADLTARLKDKDQQAVEFNLRRDVIDRNAIISARAGSEAIDRGASDRACATDISSSFQKGVAVGRAISHASTSSPAGVQPAPGRVLARDYRQAWATGAFTPGS